MHIEQTETGSESRRSWFSWLSWGCGGLSELDRRNLRRYNAWALIFALGFMASIVLLATTSLTETAVVAWTVALVPDVLGVMAVRAYVRFLREADELVRKIHLEATALGFGAGVVFILGYSAAEQAGAPELEPSIAAAFMLVMAGIGQWLAGRRYR
jgi:hypothetical protein